MRASLFLGLRLLPLVGEELSDHLIDELHGDEPDLILEFFYALEVPSVFMFLGVDKPGAENAANNHSDKFMIEDEAMKAGVKAHIVAAMQTKLN